MDVIKDALARGGRNWIGGNCTVSLMLMALGGLFQHDLVEWMSAMTYQAASGAGAQNMRELLTQMGEVHRVAKGLLDDPASAILDIDREVAGILREERFPTANFGVPLAGSLIPWIDKELETARAARNGRGRPKPTRSSAAKPILVPVDGICVRIGAMRCHSQALTLKLKRDVPLDEIEGMIASANDWVKVVPNQREDTMTGVDADGGHRHPERPGGPPAQAQHGSALPGRLHLRRPAAVGRRRTAAPHAADFAGGLKFPGAGLAPRTVNYSNKRPGSDPAEWQKPVDFPPGLAKM
jgi:aspartate-semialdehyde dehydrogenase